MPSDGFVVMMRALEEHFALRDCGDGCVEGVCRCGDVIGPHGGIALCDGQMLAICPSCLDLIPADDRPEIVSLPEAICLALTRKGLRPKYEDADDAPDAWRIWWPPQGDS